MNTLQGHEVSKPYSKASPKYTVGACADKWQTFRIGVPGSDITLASLYQWGIDDGAEFKHETGAALDENERRQLEAYKARDVQTQRILAMDAPLAAKGTWIAMLPSVEAAHVLVANKDDHSGSVAVNYGNFAAIMKTSKATVKRAVDIGEQAGLWRKDPEYKETKAGYDIPYMRLDLQPAFFRPELAQPIEQKPRGGARPGAGRKPKCPKHPTAAVKEEVTTVTTQYCAECGEILHHTTHQATRTLPDEAPVPAEIKHETGDAPAAQLETGDEIKHETVYTNGSTPVSCLKKARDVDAALINSTDQCRPSAPAIPSPGPSPAATTSPPREGDPHRPINAAYQQRRGLEAPA